MSGCVREHFLHSPQQRLRSRRILDDQRFRQVEVHMRIDRLDSQRPDRIGKIDLARLAKTADDVSNITEQEAGDGVSLLDVLGGLAVR